jgi:hypothetical protein
MRMNLPIFLLGLLVPTASMADEPKAPVAAPVPDKQICRSEEVTGSNFRERHCYTKAQWIEIDRQHDAEIRSFSDGHHSNINGR